MTIPSLQEIILHEDNDVILPISFPPKSSVYGHIITPLLIFNAYPQTEEWVYSNYIQLCIPKDQDKFADEDIEVLNFYPKYFSDVDSTFLKTYNITEDIKELTEDTLVERFMFWIKNDYYIQCFMNEGEIPGTYMYANKQFALNEQLIYGFSKPNKVFYLMAFNEKKHLVQMKLGFNDLVSAFFSAQTQQLSEQSSWISVGKKYGLMLYKIKKQIIYKFSLENFIIQLDEYISGKNSAIHFIWLNTEKMDHAFGIQVYDALEKWINKYTTEFIDYRSFFCLWDHKKIMNERLKFLYDNNFLDKDYTGEYDEVVKISNHIRLEILKYDYKGRRNVIDSIIKRLRQLKDLEYKILSKVLDELLKKWT